MKKFSEFITEIHHDDPDEVGIIILWESGRKTATKKALDEWDEFVGSQFPTHLLEGYDEWIEMKQRRVSRVLKECENKGIEFLQVLKNPNLYCENLSSLDSMMIRDLEVHGWDLYIESLNNKQK